MKSIGTLVAVVLFGLLFMSGCNSYNRFVVGDEDVDNAWSKVESAYQRRADLIPNLVNTVKGVAEFEQSTLSEVVNARAKATSINIDPSNATAEQLAQFQKAQSGLSQSLGRLMMVSERYPELKASQNFSELQAQLEGTENRIKVARDTYNDAATAYNKTIRRFPASFFANLFGFSQRAQFQAEEGAENAPEVNFDFSK